MRHSWIKVCTLAAMGFLLLVMAACEAKPVSAPVHAAVDSGFDAPDGVAKVLDGVYALYPEDAPALPQGTIDNLGLAYHMPGMEEFHGFSLPVQFYFEYIYPEGIMEEMDAIRQSMDSVEYDSEADGVAYLSGTVGDYRINISVFLKDGPDNMHYSIEMPEEYVDAEAFLKKIRIGPGPDMIYNPMGDVEYARNVFADGEQWVWAYLADASVDETVSWYREIAVAAGYADAAPEELEEGIVEIRDPGTGNRPAWTAQVQRTGRGFIYVWFSMIH